MEKKRKEKTDRRKEKNDFTFSLTAISLGRGYSEGLEGKTVFYYEQNNGLKRL
jgi:hypothetical protein